MSASDRPPLYLRRPGFNPENLFSLDTSLNDDPDCGGIAMTVRYGDPERQRVFEADQAAKRKAENIASPSKLGFPDPIDVYGAAIVTGESLPRDAEDLGEGYEASEDSGSSSASFFDDSKSEVAGDSDDGWSWGAGGAEDSRSAVEDPIPAAAYLSDFKENDFPNPNEVFGKGAKGTSMDIIE
ncbi:MAG: hypothetical protein RLN62_02940 [Rickettsiales bacterium]